MAEIWNRIKERLRDEISKQSFMTWIESTSADIDDDVLIIYCENEFNRNWLERQYKDLIFHTAKGITGETYELSFEIASSNIFTSTKDKQNDWEVIGSLEKKVASLETTIKELEHRLIILEEKSDL